MEAKEKYILDELISGNKVQFIIPVFQRNYVWTEKDCKKLYEDIIQLTHPGSEKSTHFVGAFVYKFDRLVHHHSAIQNILIDGQQRLTTLTLILKALIDYLANIGENEELIDEITETYLINKFAKEEKFRLRLKPNKIDGEVFIQIMNNKFDEIDKTSRLYQNYLYFFDRLIKDKVSHANFYNALKRLQGVGVNLDGNDNPQLIFESLNSTGIDLTDLDLIRNFLLMSVLPDLQDKFYLDYWLKIEELLADRFIDFIRDLLSFHNGIVTSSSKNKIYVAFRTYYQKNHHSIENYLKELLIEAKVYSNLITPNHPNDKVNAKLKDFVSLRMTTLYPFLYGVLKDNLNMSNPYEKNQSPNISDENLIQIIELLESYVIRRNVSNLAGGGPSQLMASMYKDIMQNYSSEFYDKPYEIIATYLMNVKTKAYFPRNEEFSREFINRDMYTNRNIKYILQRIENSRMAKEKLIFENLTIEHVMPQKLNRHWIEDLNLKKEDEDTYEVYKNRIGNLTLTAYNSNMSGKRFRDKKEHILDSKLFLNDYFKPLNEWDFDSIENRSSLLSGLALNIWKIPAASSYEIKSSTRILLLDEEVYDYTGTKPSGIEIKDEKFLAQNWSNIFVKALQIAQKENKELFKAVIDREYNNEGTRSPFSSSSEVFRQPEKISKDFFVETNNNTDKKMAILKTVFEGMGYDQEEVILFIE